MTTLKQPANSLSRRQLMKHALVLGSAAVPLAGIAPEAFAQDTAKTAEPASGAIDAHAHVWTPDVNRYPLAPAFKLADMQPPSFTPEQLLAHARPCGVSRVVLIQMSYYGFDNS